MTERMGKRKSNNYTMKMSHRLALSEAETEVVALEDEGHTVVRCTDYHWKIDGIDVWPSARKFMKHGRVRFYEQLADVVALD